MQEHLFGIGHNQPPALCVVRDQSKPEDAQAVAQRKGLTYRIAGEGAIPLRGRRAQREADERRALENAMGTLMWGLGRRTVMAAVMRRACRISIGPSSTRHPSSSLPKGVVRHPLLSLDCKREILWRWAWDEYLLELADADGMPEGDPSRLPKVKAALRLLSMEWSPDPAAPAAFIIHYRRNGEALAA